MVVECVVGKSAGLVGGHLQCHASLNLMGGCIVAQGGSPDTCLFIGIDHDGFVNNLLKARLEKDGTLHEAMGRGLLFCPPQEVGFDGWVDNGIDGCGMVVALEEVAGNDWLVEFALVCVGIRTNEFAELPAQGRVVVHQSFG